MESVIGKTGVYGLDGLALPVTITNVRSIFGRIEVKIVVECDGHPAKWVTIEKVKLKEGK